MESSDDRKRKRPAQESDMATEEKSSVMTRRPAPSEEEVEEFFTLIRRIHNVKYSGGEIAVNRASERRMELVAGLSAQLKGGSAAAKAELGKKGMKDVSIDLNAIPEEAGDANTT